MRKPNGYGSIFKLKDKNLRKRWRVCLPATYTLDENNKLVKRQKVLGNYEKQTEAIKALEKWHLEHTEGHTDEITLIAAYNKWYAWKSLSISEDWKSNIRAAIKHLEPLHYIPINKITLEQYQTIFNGLTVGKPMQGKIKTMLNSLYKFAIVSGWTTKNLSEWIKINETVEQITLPHYNYTLDEIKALWTNIDANSNKIQLVMLYTGIRIGELWKITEVNLEERWFITGSKTEAGKNRKIPIHKDIVPIFMDVVELTKRYGEGNIRLIIKQNDFGHRPHDTRHTFAWMLDRLGVNLLTIKKIMGHKLKDVTADVYISIDIKDLIEAVDKIDLAKLE